MRVAVSLEERGPAPRQPPTSTLQPEPANTTAGVCFPMLFCCFCPCVSLLQPLKERDGEHMRLRHSRALTTML